ncbi:hypothetical protein CDL15_Pgr018267 [Punica granatum]|uniref:Uncharacterized protein n=1 Tax=Punica granatum TaxID=22663 RepID=A0A218WK20_PUNGR|nr:hypothetical protein CDL15_Pgr018267 [Punica granatum]PKI76076.1 hypothetical protein CRG98_003437 [Punica granatum]
MGGNSSKKSSSSAPTTSLCGRSSHSRDDSQIPDDTMSLRMVSEHDKGRYFADPGIDRKAPAEIAKRHEKWKSEAKHHERQ